MREPAPGVVRAAVLDLGSNSFHVLVADLDGRRITPLLREREMLHLGRAVGATGEVGASVRRAAVEVVNHHAGLARRAGAVEVHVVATAAIRDAADRGEVLAELAAAAGSAIRLLDGDEEARLSYLGARAAVAIEGEPVVLVDLGGGSLEIAEGIGGRVTSTASLPLGASRLSAAVDADPPTASDLTRLHTAVDDALAAHPRLPGRAPRVVAVGGPVRALARITVHDRWLPASPNQIPVRTDDLAAIRDRLTAVDVDGRLALPGVKARRADHLHIAAVVLTRVLRHLGADEATVSSWGLREGVLLDTHGVAEPLDAEALRADEVERLRTAFAPNDPHPPHVARLASALFDATVERHGLHPRDRGLLTAAAALHGIGEALALRRQHRHAAYLVEHGELRGFSPTETAVITLLVRSQRGDDVAVDHPAHRGLHPEDRGRLRKLLGLLHLADVLDRAHDQAVTGVEVRCCADTTHLTLAGDGLHITDDELSRRTGLAVEVLGGPIVIHDGDVTRTLGAGP